MTKGYEGKQRLSPWISKDIVVAAKVKAILNGKTLQQVIEDLLEGWVNEDNNAKENDRRSVSQ
ncbi:hypothetical protein QUF58_01720 [Anaerolineales bacterium HSG24]|nr:hypothetical protein [Anaerolineales bacterium HSG24]